MDSRQRRIREIVDRDFKSLELILLLREEGKVDFRKALLYAGLIVGVIFLPAIGQVPRPYPIQILLAQAILIGVCVRSLWYYGYHCYLDLSLCYLSFYGRLLRYQLEWKAVTIKKPSKRYIFFKDVEAYENELRAYVRIYRRNLDRWRREDNWAKVGAELTKELETILKKFELSTDERSTIFERWESIANPKGKKRYLSMLESQLGHKVFMSGRVLATSPAISEEEGVSEEGDETDIRLNMLDSQASKVAKEESRRLVVAAMAETNRRDKIRLLKQALRLDAQVEQSSVASASNAAEMTPKVLADVHFISLQDLARERLSFLGMVPHRVDSIMVREIILALLAPGKAGRRFQAAYRAEDTLRVTVRRQYEVHLRKQFNPKVFRENLSWLVNEKVLFTKPKTDEQVYSLSSKTRGKSIDAQKVIRAFLDFDRSLRIV